MAALDAPSRQGSGNWSWLHMPLVVLAGLTLAMVITDVVYSFKNQGIQREINQRQQFINESIQLSRVNEALVRYLAAAAASYKDEKLVALLGQEGITLSTPQPAPAESQAPAAAPATTEKKGK